MQKFKLEKTTENFDVSLNAYKIDKEVRGFLGSGTLHIKLKGAEKNFISVKNCSVRRSKAGNLFLSTPQYKSNDTYENVVGMSTEIFDVVTEFSNTINTTFNKVAHGANIPVEQADSKVDPVAGNAIKIS